MTLIILIISSLSGIWANEPPVYLPPDVSSASYSGSAFAPLANPVFADINGSSLLAYRYAGFKDHSEGSHFFMAKILGLSFFYARHNYLMDGEGKELISAKTDFYNVSRGFFFNDTFGFGLGYSFSNSRDPLFDNYKAWTAGILFRPYRYVSFGLSVQDINSRIRGKPVKRKNIFSVSLRPFTERITFSLDAAGREGLSYRDMNYSYSLEARVLSDISLLFKWDEEKNYFFGIRMPFYLRYGSASSPIIDSYFSYNRDGAPHYFGAGFSVPNTIHNRAIVISERNMLRINIKGIINENEISDFFEKREIVFLDIIRAVKKAASDQSIEGIILRIDDAGLGFGQIQELRRELKSFRRTGKKVYSIMTTPGNKEYYLAAAADKIYFTPNSTFSLTGLKAEIYFFKDMLEKAGIKYESVRAGKYKSFNEAFTRQGMSPEARENLESLLKDINEQYLSDISSDRNLGRSEIEKIFQMGIMGPEKAKSLKYVDDIKYPEDALKDIGEDISIVKLSNYISEKERDYGWSRKPSIAVIYVKGTIIRGDSKISRHLDNMGDATYEKLLNYAFRHDSIKSIVIRISSGGGSAAASDYMWNSLIKLKKKYNKPVVFSFGNIAASGGYYIACTGDKIFSNRGTITGSVGVVFGKISLKELYNKLGIKKEIIKMSEFADIFSESRELSNREKKIIRKSIDFIYKRFRKRVEYGRNIRHDKIPSVTEGRIFTGSQAEHNKLVDEMGGLSSAVEYARLAGGIDGSYRIKELPKHTLLFNSLIRQDYDILLFPYMYKFLRKIGAGYFNMNGILYVMPYYIEIE